MKSYKFSAFFIIAILLFSSSFSMAEDFKDFAELDLEELLNTEVYSASKRVQKLYESANAITVITEEDIKHSGAVDLPDLFRRVPGISVVNVFGSSHGVSARGFNEWFVAGMLVMIDGRSIYKSIFGGVFWEDQQTFLEDIKRIEIIRGPGATMWGANAVNGVINIITKDPEYNHNASITAKVGSRNFRETVLQYSDSLSNKVSVSINLGYQEDEGARGTNDFRRVPKATGRFKYRFSDASVLHFHAGVHESEVGIDLNVFSNRTDFNVRSNFQMLRWEHQISDSSQFQFRFSRDDFAARSSNKKLVIDENKYDFEIQHSFSLGKRNAIIWGGNYRTTKADTTLMQPEDDHDDLIGFFLQDELTIFDNLKFVGGIKYEENSFTGGDWSPRGCILFSPWSNHYFRLSIARAYRTPTFVEDSFNISQTLPPPLPPIPLVLAIGNSNLDPEETTAFELGYRTTLLNRIGFNVELYYNEVDDIIEFERIRIGLPLIIGSENSFNTIAKGVEIDMNIPVTHWWTVKANYTFQEVENKRDNRDVKGSPKHKFNLASYFNFSNGLSLSTMLYYVDEGRWYDVTLPPVKVDDYWRFDIRIAQKLFNNKVELSLVGQNLTDKLHPETSDGLEPYEVERLIYGQIILKF